jgi:ABC-type branched-subunit amino acid transport system ATPase component/ABC-type branched-subunit amino acid transport system permease subunit
VSALAARRPSTRLLTAAVVVVLFVLTRLTPGAVPIGVVVQGVVFGATSGLLALGLVLTYQATRIVNFAHGAVGSVAGALGVSLYFGPGWPWWAAVIAGVVAGGVTGALVDALVIRRFAAASRLTLTVATIGLAQLLGGISLLLPGWLGAPALVGAFDTGLSDINVRLRPVLFTGNELLMVAVVPIAVLGLVWFLQKTDAGVAVRAAAEDRDRARLLAVPVARLSTLVWTTAGVLAAITVLMTAPSQGMANNLGVAPVVLLPALAAAVVAGMRSLSLAFGAAVALGVMDQLVRWHVHTKSVTTVVFLVVIVVALLLRRDALGRDEPGEASLAGGRAATSSTWSHVRTQPLGRAIRWSSLAVVAAAVLLAPLVLSTTDVFLFTTGVIYAMVVVSLVALTGWGGQISLGQFAIVGVGGVVASNLVLRHNVDLFWALVAAGLAGALMAVLIGLPALRIRGPFLAVSTLAFAVAADAYAFNPNSFQEWLPFSVDRPVLFGHWDLASETAFSYVAVALLVATVLLLTGLRRGRPGRSVLAVRDNTRAASALAVPVTRTRLSTFVLAGAVAGVAGGLHVHLLGGLGLHTYAPATSLVLFSMAVIGGIESIPGAIAGVVVIQVLGRIWPEYQLLLTGIGMLFLLLVVPGGLAEVGRRIRDRAVARLVPAARPEARLRADPEADASASGAARPTATATAGGGLLSCAGAEAAYGPLQVLFGVDLAVGEGEVVALLGTNGAGKSSVLRAITGLLPVSRGEVWFDGQRIDGRSPEAIARAGISMVPGGRGVFPGLTVEENLRVASWAFRRDAALVGERREEVLDLLPALRSRLGQTAGSLSGGEQQMLALAQAFLGRPRVLLIDELSLGLAPTVVALLLDVVRAKVAEGVTVVIVEQSVNVALAVAERAVFLEKGEVRFTGPTAELLDRPDVLHAVFLPGVTAGARTRPRGERVEPVPGAVPALSCSGLRRRFGGVVAVDGVDLDVGAGQIVGLIGHNGAGKTTLFDLISGFTEPDEGRVHLEGVDVSTMGPADRAVRGLARSFQEARLFPSLDVVETLSVALDRHLRGRGDGFVAASLRLPAATDTEKIVAARVEELVDQLGLGRYARTATGHLSTGTRRIVELACMLAADPRVLLLDEPSAGVAQRETEHLGPLLRRVQVETGCSIVIIEHDMPLLTDLCDELVALERGAVITRGNPDEVLAHARVLESYLGTDETTIARSGARAT